VSGEASDLRRRRLAFIRRKRNRKKKAGSMTVIEHLDELRSRLIKAFMALGIVAIIAFAFYPQVLDFIVAPLDTLPPDLKERILTQEGTDEARITVTGPLEGLNVRLKVTAMLAFIFASPIWLYQIWAFVTPGLTVKEKKYAVPFMLSSVALFALGITFAYVTLPAALRFLIGIAGPDVTVLFGAQQYINFVGLMLLAFGLTFQLPLILYFLGLVGVVSVQQLRDHRKMAAVGTAALSAVVTPTQDPFTMLAMWVPLYLLFELAILLLAIRDRRRRRRGATT
jgi:sec-independent protein translocase protein TatC